ncbi:MAG: DUF3786 domain-containing protein [Planctomycetota bacterium]
MSGSVRAPNDLSLAEDLAWRSLAAADLDAVCRNTLARPFDGGRIEIPFFLEPVLLDLSARSVEHDGPPLARVERILILHHLVASDGAPLAGRPVGFAQIPGAAGYLTPFRARVLRRLASLFGGDPASFDRVARALGGEPWPVAPHAFSFQLFPRVPVTLILWPGDADPAGAGPDAQVTFDSSVSSHLSIEDVVVSCERLLSRLSAALKESS